jgi:dihydropteroate synthase
MHQFRHSAVPGRATSWHIRTRTLPFGKRPLVMGIVNVTPDSFSDGGRFIDADRAIEHSLQLVRDGADMLDIGGESTRPYSEPVSEAEELRRVVPVVAAICAQTATPVSIDTSKAEVARECLARGAEIINDVTGLAGDPRIIEVARTSGAGVCVMHMQGTPQSMQDRPTYRDVVADIREYLCGRIDSLVAVGIDRRRICLDPGIGFGKTHQHNLTLLANCWRYHELGFPLLVGHSRKGVIGKLIGDKEADRTAGTLGIACSLAAQGVQILRVHDVRAVREALLLFESSGGIDGQAALVE